MTETWKKILLEGDAVPAENVEAGHLGSGSYAIDGALAVDTLNEYTEDEGVTVDYVNLKDRTVAVDAVIVNPPAKPAAEEGVVRLPNAEWIKARNAANDGDVNLARVNADDEVEIGRVSRINLGTATGAAAGELWASGRARLGGGLSETTEPRLTLQGWDSYGFTAFDTPETNVFRMRTAYDKLVLQGGANDSNLREVHIRSGLTKYGIVIGTSGSVRIVDKVGFYDTTPQSKQTASGSRGGNAALASLLTALATLGLITNDTTA